MDPFSLYWDIAAQLRRDQLAQAQTKIRKTLRQTGEIGAESAVLVACVLHLTGFPAHRILHFLSLYLPGGIRLSLFELAVNAIFLGEPPIPAPLLYDITQYTYLEKRLLVRKSIEISDTLKGSLSPAVLLYLYLLSLRDDLSNENIQLIALIMKNCFPALELRTRIGGASLEEYGEIARAWKNAEKRSLDLEIGPGAGAERRSRRAFDRDSASFFLDKYFSDEALSEMRASAPPPARRVPPRGASGRPGAARAGGGEETASLAPSSRAESSAARTKRRKSAQHESDHEAPAGVGPVGRQDAAEYVGRPNAAEDIGRPNAAEYVGRVVKTKATGDRVIARGVRGARGEPGAATAATVSRGGGGIRAVERHARASRVEARGALWLVIRAAPTVLACVVMAMILIQLPAPGPRTNAASPAPASAAAISAPPQSIPSAAPAAQPQPGPSAQPQPATSVPAMTTYVVRPGDSLWRIFSSMRAESTDRKGWMDFLSKAQSLNSLENPDLLQPGKVLTLSAKE